MSDSGKPFDQWLELTRELQATVYGRDLWNLTGVERAECFTRDLAETFIELGELANEFPGHKSWVTDRDVMDREAMIGEAVDALHFLGNVLAVIQCTDDELNAAYLKKMQKNRDRMSSGTYDGVNDKCPECHRELVTTRIELADGAIEFDISCPAHGLQSIKWSRV